MSYLKNLLSSNEEIESTLKKILKDVPEVNFNNFFEGFGLKIYIKALSLYNRFYIKERWAKKLYNNTNKIETAYAKAIQIFEEYKIRGQENNLINNYKVIEDSLKRDNEEITKERIIHFLYKNSILIEFVPEDIKNEAKISKVNITLMQFLMKHFIACEKSNFTNFINSALANLKYNPTHCIIYRNNNLSIEEIKKDFYSNNRKNQHKSDNYEIITNIFRYDAIPDGVIFFKFTKLPHVKTSPKEFVLIYLNEYPRMYFPIEGIQGKENIKFMNFLPVFNNYKHYQFPIIEENTPIACRGEEEVVIGCKDFMNIIPTQKNLEELFTDSFRKKGKIVLEKEEFQMETDKINFISSPQATDLGFFAAELKVHKDRIINVNHIPIKDPNDIIQREPYLAFEYDHNTFSWWMIDKGSLYGRKVIVENSGHEKVNPSSSNTFHIKDRVYTVYYYDLSQDSNYFVNIEYLIKNTRLIVKLGSIYDYEFNQISEQADTAVEDYLKNIFKEKYHQYGTASGGILFSGKINNQECFLKIYDKPMNININDQMSAFEDIIINFIPYRIADKITELTGEEIYLGQQNFEDAVKTITITPPLKMPDLSKNKAKTIKDILLYIKNCNNHGFLIYDILLNRESDNKLVSNWLYSEDDRITITDLGAYYKNTRNDFKRYYQSYKRRHKIPSDEIKPIVWQLYLTGVLCYQVWKESVEIPNSGLPKQTSPIIIKDNDRLQRSLQGFIDLKHSQLNDKLIDDIIKAFEESRKYKEDYVIQKKNDLKN